MGIFLGVGFYLLVLLGWWWLLHRADVIGRVDRSPIRASWTSVLAQLTVVSALWALILADPSDLGGATAFTIANTPILILFVAAGLWSELSAEGAAAYRWLTMAAAASALAAFLLARRRSLPWSHLSLAAPITVAGVMILGGAEMVSSQMMESQARELGADCLYRVPFLVSLRNGQNEFQFWNHAFIEIGDRTMVWSYSRGAFLPEEKNPRYGVKDGYACEALSPRPG